MFGNLVILTGAGISAESGIRTFRAADGLWEEHKIEDVATPEGFARNPALVHTFYNARRAKLKEVQPNPAHLALAEYERKHYPSSSFPQKRESQPSSFPQKRESPSFLLITQNVDDLHERAGSRQMLHLHGELLKMRCQRCDQSMPITTDLHKDDQCPQCQQSGGLRPDIVWFGEMPHHLPQITAALQQCQTFVSIGTSGNVYPAAGFVDIAKSNGAQCIELNLEPTPQTSQIFHQSHQGKATTLIPQFFS